jgi:Ca-activated chloride channel homolog
MSFGSPLFLVALLLVPAAVAVYVVLERRTSRYGVLFSNLDVLASVVEERRSWARHVPAALLLAAVTALLVALARPTITVAAPQERATVVLLVDVSGSMRAEDVAPSRLEAARSAMRSFLDRVPKEIRVSVVAFSDTPEVVVPPTSDRALARAGIDFLAPGFGTALGDGLARAAELAAGVGEDGSSGQAPVGADGKSLAAVLLLSDGKQTRGELTPEDGAARAKRAHVPVYAIALGTDAGTIDAAADRCDHGGRVLRRARRRAPDFGLPASRLAGGPGRRGARGQCRLRRGRRPPGGCRARGGDRARPAFAITRADDARRAARPPLAAAFRGLWRVSDPRVSGSETALRRIGFARANPRLRRKA